MLRPVLEVGKDDRDSERGEQEEQGQDGQVGVKVGSGAQEEDGGRCSPPPSGLLVAISNATLTLGRLLNFLSLS